MERCICIQVSENKTQSRHTSWGASSSVISYKYPRWYKQPQVCHGTSGVIVVIQLQRQSKIWTPENTLFCLWFTLSLGLRDGVNHSHGQQERNLNCSATLLTSVNASSSRGVMLDGLTEVEVPTRAKGPEAPRTVNCLSSDLDILPKHPF